MIRGDNLYSVDELAIIIGSCTSWEDLKDVIEILVEYKTDFSVVVAMEIRDLVRERVSLLNMGL
jgi:phosphoribosylcarboxyaminoimidazole (NCAIR) mutase